MSFFNSGNTARSADSYAKKKAKVKKNSPSPLIVKTGMTNSITKHHKNGKPYGTFYVSKKETP